MSIKNLNLGPEIVNPAREAATQMYIQNLQDVQSPEEMSYAMLTLQLIATHMLALAVFNYVKDECGDPTPMFTGILKNVKGEFDALVEAEKAGKLGKFSRDFSNKRDA